jgi:long-chain acyl-CoA synthetase
VDEVGTGTPRDRTTLARLLWDRAADSPDRLAFRHEVGRPGRTAAEDLTWAHARGLVEPLAAGLVGLDVRPGDRVALLSRTRLDGVLAHLAVLCAGAATVVIDPGSPPPEVARVVHGSGAVVVLAEDLGQVEKLRVVRGDIRTVRTVVVFDGEHRDRRVMTLEALLGGGEELLTRDAAVVSDRIDLLGADALATILLPGSAAVTTAAPGAAPRAFDGVPGTHADWVRAGLAADPGAAGTSDPRPAGPPLTRPEGHARLAAQLAHGFGSVVDGRSTGNLPA